MYPRWVDVSSTIVPEKGDFKNSKKILATRGWVIIIAG
jgi:hypothetical protein